MLPAKNDLKNKCILITGGAGYIGSHACKALAEAGFLPVVYDNLSTGDRRAVKWGPFIKGDIHDTQKLLSAFKRYKPVGVMHFAARVAAGESVVKPSEYYESNVIGTKRLLDACIEGKIQNFIFSSSAAVYGVPKKLPVSEQADTTPINPYGETKLATEWMLSSYHRAYGLNYIALRYFNAAGADPDGEIGPYQENLHNLIPCIMDVLAGKRRRLEVFGSNYATADGTALRDYVHVSDLASAHVKALRYLLKNGKSQSLNLGTGRGHTVMKVIHAAEKSSGKKISIKMSARRPGDPAKLVADSRQAKNILKWAPAYTTIDSIVSTAFAWAGKRGRR